MGRYLGWRPTSTGLPARRRCDRRSVAEDHPHAVCSAQQTIICTWFEAFQRHGCSHKLTLPR